MRGWHTLSCSPRNRRYNLGSVSNVLEIVTTSSEKGCFALGPAPPSPPLGVFILWPFEDGFMCYFGDFSPVLSYFLLNLTPIPPVRAVLVFLFFSSFYSRPAVFKPVLKPRIHHLSFSSPRMAFSEPEDTTLWSENWHINQNDFQVGALEEECERTNGSIFTHVQVLRLRFVIEIANH